MDPLLPPPPIAFPAVVTAAAAAADEPPPPPPHNHIAHVANATPSIPPAFNHPPYAEMIYAAITALKEREGSSRQAIAKYIERVYTGLPPTHSALLTHHLKRLKNSGLLVMVKKSYKLPRSDLYDSSNNNNKDYVPFPPDFTTGGVDVGGGNNFFSAAVGSADSGLHFPSASVKRGRGRPPKAKPTTQIGQNGEQFVEGGDVQLGIGAQPFTGFQSITQQLAAMQQQQHQFVAGMAQMQGIQPIPPQVGGIEGIGGQGDAGMQPVLVALGLAEDPNSMAKRGPGRPKKVLEQGGQVMIAKRGRGRPRKGVGRPRKPQSVTGVMGANGVKRGPGRPPKIQPTTTTSATDAVPVTSPAGGDATMVTSVPRPRGRPRKSVGLGPGGNVVMMPKRPGRPPKKGTGRPVGRPRKTAYPLAATEADTEGYGDLKQKLEFFQSKVKEAVGYLRPLVVPETEPTIAGAILELEGLASMEINTPSSREEEPQPQPKPTQPLSELGL